MNPKYRHFFYEILITVGIVLGFVQFVWVEGACAWRAEHLRICLILTKVARMTLVLALALYLYLEFTMCSASMSVYGTLATFPFLVDALLCKLNRLLVGII